MSRVKGVAVVLMIKFIKKNYKDRLNRVIEVLPAESSKYLQEHILVTEWYPYRLYTDLLRALDTIVGNGDLSYCVELGKLAAQDHLSTIFKIFMNFSSTQSMLSKIIVAWNSYYDTGAVEFPLFTDKEATYIIKDFPDIDMSHVKNAQGWVEQFLLTSGQYTSIQAEITKCQCTGDPVTEIHFTFNS